MPFDGASFAAALSSDKAKKPPNWPVNRDLVSDEWGWFWQGDPAGLRCPFWENGGKPVSYAGKNNFEAASVDSSGSWVAGPFGTGLKFTSGGSLITWNESDVNIFSPTNTALTLFIAMEVTNTSGWLDFLNAQTSGGSGEDRLLLQSGTNKLWNWEKEFVTLPTNPRNDGLVHTYSYSRKKSPTKGEGVFFFDGVDMGTPSTGVGSYGSSTSVWKVGGFAPLGTIYAIYALPFECTKTQHAMLHQDVFGPFRPDMAKLLPMLIKAPAVAAGGPVAGSLGLMGVGI